MRGSRGSTGRGRARRTSQDSTGSGVWPARTSGRTTTDTVKHGAVKHGAAITTGVVAGAAVIVVAVFAVFGTPAVQPVKQVGVGPAAAVLIDATITRDVPLPAVTALPGERNRHFPKWLHRRPDRPQGEAPETVAPTARRDGGGPGGRGEHKPVRG